MVTEISAYKFRLWEIRFHNIDLNIPGYDEKNPSGRVFVETGLNFALEDNDLFCSVTLEVKLIKGNEGEFTEDDEAASLILKGTGRFELPENHGIEEDRLQELSDLEVRTFGKIMEPPLLMKAKSILSDAGVEGGGLPLQLAEPIS